MNVAWPPAKSWMLVVSVALRRDSGTARPIAARIAASAASVARRFAGRSMTTRSPVTTWPPKPRMSSRALTVAPS